MALAPDLYQPRRDLAQSYADRAMLAGRGRDHRLVIEASSRAIDTLSLMLDRYSGHPPTRHTLAFVYGMRATAYRRLKQFPGTITDWTRAIEYAAPPRRPEGHAMRAVSYVLNGQTAEAVADVDTALKQPDLKAPFLYNCACVLALASDKVPEKREVFAVRAVVLLRWAGQAEPARLAAAKTDADFDPVRDREDFRKLLAEGAKPAPGQEPPANSRPAKE